MFAQYAFSNDGVQRVAMIFVLFAIVSYHSVLFRIASNALSNAVSVSERMRIEAF